MSVNRLTSFVCEKSRPIDIFFIWRSLMLLLCAVASRTRLLGSFIHSYSFFSRTKPHITPFELSYTMITWPKCTGIVDSFSTPCIHHQHLFFHRMLFQSQNAGVMLSIFRENWLFSDIMFSTVRMNGWFHDACLVAFALLDTRFVQFRSFWWFYNCLRLMCAYHWAISLLFASTCLVVLVLFQYYDNCIYCIWLLARVFSLLSTKE